MSLFVEFELGDDGYLLDVSQVVRILPLVAIKRIPHAVRGVAGAFTYGGVSVPVIDLTELAVGTPARRHFSTRMILVRYPDRSGREQLLAVIAEKVTQVAKYQPAEFTASGVTSEAAPYLGSICVAGGRLLQQVDVHKLLPADVSDVLFRETEEESWSAQSKHC